MPRPHTIVGLSSRSRGLAASPQRLPLAPVPAPRLPKPRARRVVRLVPGGIPLQQLGAAYESLASMVLARKMLSEGPLMPWEASDFMDRAGLPAEWRTHALTQAVFTASAEDLGKGGVIGAIGGAVSDAVQTVGKAVTTVTKPVLNTTGQVLKTIAPIANNIPVIGPAVAAATGAVGTQLNVLANNSLKSAIQHPGALVGQVVQGGMAAMNQGAALGPKPPTQGIASAGTPIIWEGPPTQLDLAFQTQASDYAIFKARFTQWSDALTSQPSGSWLGKMGGTLYRIQKDSAGAYSVWRLSPSEVSTSISAQVTDGNIAPMDASLWAAPDAPAGAGYSVPSLGGGGVPQAGYAVPNSPYALDPAGMSLPGGPGGAGLLGDQASANLLVQAVRDSLAKQAGGASSGPSGVLILGLGGLAVAAAFYFRPKRRGRR